jgi:tetratricopeptide (TPR) repeat protein
MANTWKSPAAGAALILLVTLVAYLPALRCGYVWDDDIYVTGNPLLTAPDGLKRIWFAPHTYPAYFPMVNTTLRFEHMLWGLNPAGYHCVNILLHCVNALLVWTVLRRLAVPGAWLAAAIWAIHPVNVESVAWITELKNTQSTLFYLLTLWAWMKFTDRQTVRPWRWYSLALLLYGPALFSKTTASTLPAAMLLVLWLRREPIGWRRVVQVVPFLGYGVGIGLLSLWCEAHEGNYAEALRYSYGGVGRLLIATHALWFYAAKLAWPARLTFSYPRWEINPRDPLQYLWLIACVAIALLLWWRRRALGRGPAAAVVFFVAALSPLLGFIPVYTFVYSFVADHYQYVASMGLIALFAGAVSSQADTWQLGHTMRCTLSAALLVVLGALTWQQARIYQNVETLWGDTLMKNSQSWMAHLNLGNVLLQEGRVSDAIGHYEQTLRIKPDCARAENSLGAALYETGTCAEAIEHYQQALRIKPDYAEAHRNLGIAFAQTGKIADAIAHYQQALQIRPDFVEAHFSLATALQQTGKLDEAVAHYEQVVHLQPDYAEARNNLGVVLVRLGRVSEAVEHFEQVLRSNPDDAEVHYNLGVLLVRLGKVPEAIVHYEQALRIRPDDPKFQNNLAWLLATTPDVGDPGRAVTLAERACTLTNNRAPTYLDTLAAAYAAAGRFDAAVGTAQQAIQLADATGQTRLASRIKLRLELYRADHAYYAPRNLTGSRNP